MTSLHLERRGEQRRLTAGPSADQLPAGWARIPVLFQVTLLSEVMEGARREGLLLIGSAYASDLDTLTLPTGSAFPLTYG